MSKRVKNWTTDLADRKFSEYIRARDPICAYCGINKTSDNSHYWRRGHSGTRFDPENCDGFCRPCHDSLEHQKNEDYLQWKLEQLGRERYDAMELRARRFKQRSEAVAECQAWLKSYAQAVHT